MQLDHQRFSVPGMLVSVSDGVSAIQHHSSGLADIQKQTPIGASSASMLFPCGEITRTFTSAILLRLADMRGVDIDASLEHLVRIHQEDDGLLLLLTGLYPFLKPVSIRELLTQRAGLPAFDRTLAYNQTFLAKPRKKWQIENYFDAISGGDVQYQRGYAEGRRGTYSNSATHFLVAGLVAEAIAGVPLSTLMTELFDQYGLSETHYVPYGVIKRDAFTELLCGYVPLSHPYASAFRQQPVLYYNDNKELQVYPVTGFYCLNGMANAATLSTTSDLIRWFQTLVGGQVMVGPYDTVLAQSWDTTTQQGCALLGLAGHSLGTEILLAHLVSIQRTLALVINVSRQYLCLNDHDLVSEVIEQCLIL